MTDYKKIADLLYPNNKYTVEQVEKMFPDRKLKEGAEVTRFAPSPTGYLHLGHFFQSVVDKFLAKKTGGLFLFRLEDTDSKRAVEGAEELALKFLDEYGLSSDEGLTAKGTIGQYGPYRQSERVEFYNAYAKMLVEKGRAFPCFCDAPDGKDEILENREKMLEETSTIVEHDVCRDLTYEQVKANIEQGKPFAIRLRSMNKEGDKIVIKDRIKGNREIPANLKDTVLIKKDGIPPYPFAHPVDDHLMKTTTVVRGEDWFSSVAQHVEIFEALGFEPIEYIHTALICKIDEQTGNKRKLSKRKDPENNVMYFGEQGYPKTGVLEYLLTLINSNFEDWRKENPTASLFDFPFSVEKMGVSSPMFDLIKLNDVSKNVISRMKAADVYNETLTWAKENDKEFAEVLENNKHLAINALNIDREIERPRKDITTYKEVKELYNYFFNEIFNEKELLNFDVKYSKETITKFLTAYKKSYSLDVQKDEWFNTVKEVASACGFATDNKLYKQNPSAYAGNTADACTIIRVALTGRTQTPDLYSIMRTLGKNEINSRIGYVLKNI